MILHSFGIRWHSLRMVSFLCAYLRMGYCSCPFYCSKIYSYLYRSFDTVLFWVSYVCSRKLFLRNIVSVPVFLVRQKWNNYMKRSTKVLIFIFQRCSVRYSFISWNVSMKLYVSTGSNDNLLPLFTDLFPFLQSILRPFSVSITAEVSSSYYILFERLPSL